MIFRWEAKEFGPMDLWYIVSSSVSLMWAFESPKSDLYSPSYDIFTWKGLRGRAVWSSSTERMSRVAELYWLSSLRTS